MGRCEELRQRPFAQEGLRMFRKLVLAAATGIAVGSVMSVASANATPMDYLVSFTATNWDTGTGSDPSGSQSGSFILFNFDPAVANYDTTSGISWVSHSFVVNSPISYNNLNGYYDTNNHFFDNILVVGGTHYNTAVVDYPPDSNDFYLQIADFSGSPYMAQFGYTTSSGQYSYTTTGGSGGSLSVTPYVAPVPLPAALPLFASAFGGAGVFSRWRKRRKAAPAAAAA